MLPLLDQNEALILTLACVGIITVVLKFIDTLCMLVLLVRAYLIPYFRPIAARELNKKYGSWALITGCTDGVGKEYALQLAQRGLNVVLVSRSNDKLQTLSKELEVKFSVKIKTIVADFSKGHEAIKIIKENLRYIPTIGILVNNVGKMYEYPMNLGEVPEQDLWDIISINVGAVTMLTRLLINDMEKRGKGAIVNISSGASHQPLPLMNVYAATKMYINGFTEGLREEYSHSGLTFQCLTPFFISTKMSDFITDLKNHTVFVPNAATFAKSAVNSLGRVDSAAGYWSHEIQGFVVSLVPKKIKIIFGKHINKRFKRRYLKQVRGSDL